MNETGKYIIPIQGIIGESFFHTDLLMHLNNAKNFLHVELAIDSLGGYVDEGLKMKTTLERSGKILHSINTGDVASIAVSLFLVSPKENRLYDPSKGMFLVHNPWTDNITGDAAKLAEISKELGKLETDLAKQYHMTTGTDIELLKAFMSENKPLTPEQVVSLGFASLVSEQNFKPIAYYKPLNSIDMNKEQESLFEKIMAKLDKLFSPKCMIIQDVNSTELELPDITETSQIAVGITVKIAGNPANGEFTMPDGSIYVVENGVLSEIKMPEMDALKKENEQLQAKVIELETKNKSIQSEVEKIKAEFVSFKSQFSKENPATAQTPSTVPNKEQKVLIRKPYKTS